MPVAALTFVGVVSLVFGAYWFFVAERSNANRSLLKRRLKGRRPRSDSNQHRRQAAEAGTGAQRYRSAERRAFEFPGAMDPIRSFVNNSGLQITVGTFRPAVDGRDVP